MKNDELLKAIEELKATIAEATEVIKGLENKLNELEPKSKLKVGDICIVTGDAGRCNHAVDVGSCVKIVEPISTIGSFLSMDTNGTTWFINYRDLKKVF